MNKLTNLDRYLEAIDELEIYSEDYIIIEKLLSQLSAPLFTKVLEEVISGNLYWSDFTPYLEYTNYATILDDELSSQGKIMKDLNRYITFRKYISRNYAGFENRGYDSDTTLLCVTKPASKSSTYLKYEDGNGKTQTLYGTEFERIRNNILYNLTKIDAKDTAVSIACKKALYERIQNGLLKAEGQEVDGNYIDPDDVFFFMTTYILPIPYEYQILDAFDREYMKDNQLSEEEMKKFKSLRLFIAKEHLYKENGGE